MSEFSQNPTSLQDAERTRHRLEIFNQLFRGLLLISGGGIVALLAFLQAIRDNSPLSRVVLVGIFFLSLSLFLALLFMKYRYQTSEEDQNRSGLAMVYKSKERKCLNWSIFTVFTAMILLVLGSLLYL